MITYRHKILLDKIRDRIRPEEIQNAKTVLLFVAMFLVIGFFAMKIFDSLNSGLDSQKRMENIATQVDKLEKENKVLKSEKDAAISESEVEAQYRALGYKKPGEEVFIVARSASPTPTAPEQVSLVEDKSSESNWKIWLNLIFN